MKPDPLMRRDPRHSTTTPRAWRLLGMLLLALLMVWLTEVQAQTTVSARPVIGVNALWGPGDAASLQQRFRKARALGVREVRLDWEWRQVEATRGRYDWSRLDTLVAVARAEGVRLLPIVHYAPAWAEVKTFSLFGLGRDPSIYEMAPAEAYHADYARFLRASIERYGPGGKAPVAFDPIVHWQVWNEPNLKNFWGPSPDAAAFARMMQKVQKEIAPLRSTVRIVHAGLSKPDLNYLWAVWNQNPKHGDTFDIMAVHPYLYGADGIREPEAMDADDPSTAALGFVGSTADPGYLGKVFNLQVFMTLRGAPGRPIWITEMGYFVHASHALGVTETGQAERMLRTLDFIEQRLGALPYGPGPRALPPGVERVYWFALQDYPSPDGFGQFGLHRADGSARPSATALRQRLMQ